MLFDPLLFVKMKARRADEHFQSLEKGLAEWATKPYTVIEKTDFEKALHIVRIEITPTPEIIAMLLGDFVCCLRSSLDQLAWGLAHLDTKRIFSERDQRNIAFPVFRIDDSTYRDRLKLFPATVAKEIDPFQPYHRCNAYRDDPLWQLNELWTLDKHRTIPTTPYTLNLGFAMTGWERFARINRLTYNLEVCFPLALAWASKVDLKPNISVEILFGETNTFEIPLGRLREINDFVRNDVIPRFTGFFT
jgi:hypothetical protein